MSRLIAAVIVILLAMPLLGADCSGGGGGGGGNAEDTGLDNAGGGGANDRAQKDTAEPFKPREFSGDGSLNIGTINVTEDAILEWTNKGPNYARFFSVTDAGFKLNVISEGKSGQSVVPAGTYKNIDVSGNKWTMTIRPR